MMLLSKCFLLYISGVLMYGTITEIDAPKGRARVKFFERNNIVSNWLPVSVPAALNNKHEFWPDVNEDVWCIMDNDCENGIIGGAYYHENNTPNIGNEDIESVTFSDGTVVKYDRGNSVLTIDCKGDVIVKADGDITLDNGEVTVTGDLKVDGSINVTGGVSSVGSIESDAEVVALASSVPLHLSTHTHPYTDTPIGPVTTLPPTPGS